MNRIATLTLIASLSVVLAGCDLFGIDLPSGDKTSPQYWGELYLKIYEDERQIDALEPGPAPLEEPRVVLLVTGVTIPAEWFDPIVARLERDGFRPVVYEPPELLSGSLFQATEDLAVVVDGIRAETGQDKIDILAECTAGVVARHYIQSHGGADKVSRLVTFVSPHHGIDKAPLAAAYAGWPALYDLTPGSEFLTAVNSVPLPEGVPVTSIYTCSDEYIQPWQGSIVPGANNIGLCDEFVGHFETFYDPEIYLIMHTALTEPIEGDDEPLPVPEEDEDEREDGDDRPDDRGDDGENVDQEEAFENDPTPEGDALDRDWDFEGDDDRGEGEFAADPYDDYNPGGCTTAASPAPSGLLSAALLAGLFLGLWGIALRRRPRLTPGVQSS